MNEPKMGTTAKVRPSSGLMVAYPGANRIYLAPDGEEVVWSDYWHRRLRDGSISVIAPPVAAVPAVPAPSSPQPSAPPAPDSEK